MSPAFINGPFDGQEGCVHRQDNFSINRPAIVALQLTDMDATKTDLFFGQCRCLLVFMAGIDIPPERAIFVPYGSFGA